MGQEEWGEKQEREHGIKGEMAYINPRTYSLQVFPLLALSTAACVLVCITTAQLQQCYAFDRAETNNNLVDAKGGVFEGGEDSDSTIWFHVCSGVCSSSSHSIYSIRSTTTAGTSAKPDWQNNTRHKRGAFDPWHQPSIRGKKLGRCLRGSVHLKR